MIARADLVIMAKAPRLGHGKSRLAKELGASQALRINRALHRITLRAAASGWWRVTLAVTPRTALCLALPGVWPEPRALARIDQGQGDLGVRIAHALYGLRGPVCVVGTDLPAMAPALLQGAFKALRRASAVIGPARDGGFWLVGARKADDLIAALPGVGWSTPQAGADMAARLPGPVAFLPVLTDVDDAQSWRAAQRRSCGT